MKKIENNYIKVENLSKIVSETCALHDCHNVVDIGAGLVCLICSFNTNNKSLTINFLIVN